MTSLSSLIIHIKEKESKVALLKMKLKKRETEIENTMSDVMSLTAVRNNFKEKEILKLKQLSKGEMNHINLKEEKSVWDGILENKKAKWEEANTLLEQLQEDVLNNRFSYCDKVQNFLIKYDLLKMSFGTALEKDQFILTLKKETEDTDYAELHKKIYSLEKVSRDLTKEGDEIENAMKLKSDLDIEPSASRLFASLRSELMDLRNKVQEIDTKIIEVKTDILKKDKLIKMRYNTPTSTDQKFPHHTIPRGSQQSSIPHESFKKLRGDDRSQVYATPNNKDIKSLNLSGFTRKGFIPQTLSCTMKSHSSSLEEEVKKILSQNI